MAMTSDVGVLRRIVGAALTASAAGVISFATLSAQLPGPDSKPVDLPPGPAKAGFDIKRFSGAGNGWFETFYVKETPLLRDELKAGRVADDTPLMVFDTAQGRLALLTDQMAYHHLAQGNAGGRDWLVTF